MQEPIGILLMNTGTPDEPTEEAIRAFLGEMLSDPHLVSAPPFIWKRVLRYAILPTRPKKVIPRYERIWTDEGSPFMLHCRNQRDALRMVLAEAPAPVHVEFAMCYGNPTVKTALDSFVDHGCTRVLSLPLFPQTAYCTTLACTDRVDEAAKDYPELMVEHILDYGTDPLYLNAMEASIRGHWDHHTGSRLLFSFHSAPLINMRRGDTYDVQAMATCKAIAGRLGLHDDEWALGFHSRFDDSRKWLGPNPKKILARWAKEGVEDVAVVCPGFSADCLETLVDCGIEQRAVFEEGVRAAGGKPRFTLIPALNDREDHIACLAHLVIEHLN